MKQVLFYTLINPGLLHWAATNGSETWNQTLHRDFSDLNNIHCKSSVHLITLLTVEKNSERRDGCRRVLYQAVVLQNTKRENYSWRSVCLCSFSICVIIDESFEHSMHLTENETSTYCGLMKRTEGNVPNYWLTGSCFINAFSHLFSPCISSFSLMPIKRWAQCFRASLNSPASAHGWLQQLCPGFGSSHRCMHPGHGQETRALVQTHPIMQGCAESRDS